MNSQGNFYFPSSQLLSGTRPFLECFVFLIYPWNMFTFRIVGLRVIYLSARLRMFSQATRPVPSVLCIKYSCKGSRDLLILQVQCPLMYRKLGFTLSLVSKNFLYFSPYWSEFFFFWTGVFKMCNYLALWVFSSGIIPFWIFLMYHIPQIKQHLLSFLKEALLEYCLAYVI